MSIVFWPLFTSICFNLKSRKLMLPALHFFIPSVLQTWIEISCITRNLIIVIFYYQISLKPLKTLDLSQVSFALLFPLCYIVPSVFTNSDKGKYKGKKNL